MINKWKRGTGVVLVVGAVSLSAVACSSSGHPAPHVPGALVDPPIGKVFTGDALAGMLGALPVPEGFAVNAQGSFSSGAQVAPDSESGSLGSLSCSELALAPGSNGLGESSYATRVMQTADGAENFVTTVYQWPAASSASAFYAALISQWGGCGSFTDSLSGLSEPTTLKTLAGPAVSGASKTADLVESSTLDGFTNSTDYVVALDGDAVVIDAAGSDGAQFSGAVSDAGSMAGALLSAMNAAQLATGPAAPSGSDTGSQPYGRYGTGN